MDIRLVKECSSEFSSVGFTSFTRFSNPQKCYIQSTDEFKIYTYREHQSFDEQSCKNRILTESNKDETIRKNYCETGANAKSHIGAKTDTFIV